MWPLCCAQDRQRRADDFQRAEKIGVEIARDLFVAEFLEGAYQAVVRVVHDHIDPAECRHRLRDRGFHLRGLGDVERECATRLRMPGDKVVELCRLPRRCDEPVPSREHVRRKGASQAAGAAGGARPAVVVVRSSSHGITGGVRFAWRFGRRETASHRGPVAIILLNTVWNLITQKNAKPRSSF